MVWQSPPEVSESQRVREQTYGWCSLRLRFEARELILLRGAERVRGAALASTPRPDVLRTALSLARAGHKLGAAAPGASVVLDETEVRLLLGAAQFATDEVQWAFKTPDDQEPRRHEAVMAAFPELADRGAWRSFGLARELEALAARLQTALGSLST
jgi:hypothetical protein